jgi:hypothetical protein
MPFKSVVPAILWGLAMISGIVYADPIVFETFTDYPDDSLISTPPAGPAVGLTGDWFLDPPNYFYVNRTEADLDAGSGKAVYDMPYDDNGARTAQREAAPKHALFNQDGDVFYASFLVAPPRSDGYMLFGLTLQRLDGGGQPNLTFGMKDGRFVIGNGGVNVDVLGGVAEATEMRIVLRLEYGDGDSGPDDSEVVTVWVDPESETSLPVIDLVAADLLNRGGGRLTGISIRGDQMDGQPALFDDLMVGFSFDDVVTTQSTPSPDPLSNHPGVNGLFYDPGNPGHGFNFLVHDYGLTVFYYGHTADGRRLWLHSENFEGDLEYGRAVELEMFQAETGTFGQPDPNLTTWGSIVVELTDCDTGHASFNGLDGVLEMDFVRLTGVPGMGCQ